MEPQSKEYYLKGNQTATIIRQSKDGYKVRFTKFNEFDFKSIPGARQFLKSMGFEQVDPETLEKGTNLSGFKSN
jgi:ribosomal protein L16 Arg81 hydroxylase